MSDPFIDDYMKGLIMTSLPVMENDFHNEILKKIRAIYPCSCIFKDTGTYTNQSLNGKPYALAINDKFNSDEWTLVEGPYTDSRGIWFVRSNWKSTVDEAIEDAWIRIEHEMLRKLER